MRSKSLFYVIAALVLLGGSLSVAYAQGNSADVPLLPEAELPPLESSSCSPFFDMGSTPITLQGELATVAAGTPLFVSGKVQNDNPYPIVNGKIYIKILKQGDPGNTDFFGFDVVDEFVAAENISVAAGDMHTFSFTWNVPRAIQAGQYQAAAYFTQSDRFNFGGLTYTDHIVGGFHNFAVINETFVGEVLFDRGNVVVNSTEKYRFTGGAPRISEGQSIIPVLAGVTNTTHKPVDTQVEWKLYAWDGQRSSNLLETEVQTLKIHPNDSSVIEYTITDTEHPVYYLLGTLEHNGITSIVGMRIFREGVHMPRFEYVGLSEYPSDGGDVALVACVQDMGVSKSDQEVEVIVSLTDAESLFSTELARIDYAGMIPTDVVALTAQVSNMNSANLSLRAELFQASAFVDAIEIDYSCSDIFGEDECDSSLSQNSLLYGGIGLLALILLAVLAAVYLRGRKDNDDGLDAMPLRSQMDDGVSNIKQ